MSEANTKKTIFISSGFEIFGVRSDNDNIVVDLLFYYFFYFATQTNYNTMKKKKNINIQDDNESKKKTQYNILMMENKMAREPNKKPRGL